MAKHVTKDVKYTCDVCGAVCDPVGTINIPISSTKDFTNSINVRVSAYMPYNTADGDVCFDCFKSNILNYIDKK